ncbi:MAG: bifunctional riboflavin kinase/FAD synthetase [Fimbriimonadaceae bacterium]|nr:bifunctional riboflavin kinase/FAD synthetase [Fimbriimonadaceae bacterium]
MTVADGAATVVTIGFFDGVHRGHQQLLQRVVAVARGAGLVPAAVTFDLHSLEVVHGRGPLRTILTTAEKVAALRAAGLQRVEVYPFTAEFAQQSGAAFVERLVADLRPARILVGHDFRFGRQRACGVAELTACAARQQVAVEAVELLAADGSKVGSRAIREAIEAGQVTLAASLLGRPYRLSGEVVQGQQLGRQIGFPTANLAVDPRKVLPAHGVYAVRASGADELAAAAVLNVGVRPTVSGVGLSIEAHLLDWTGDLYGRTLTLDLLARLRAEQRFDGLPALQAQIARDVAAARAALAETT